MVAKKEIPIFQRRERLYTALLAAKQRKIPTGFNTESKPAQSFGNIVWKGNIQKVDDADSRLGIGLCAAFDLFRG